MRAAEGECIARPEWFKKEPCECAIPYDSSVMSPKELEVRVAVRLEDITRDFGLVIPKSKGGLSGGGIIE